MRIALCLFLALNLLILPVQATVLGGGTAQLKNSRAVTTGQAFFLAGDLPQGGVGSGVAWPTANKAFYMPVVLYEQKTVDKIACGTNGVTSGNVDLGIYNRSGTRLVSSGSTAHGTTVVADVTDTVLAAGQYYVAISVDNTTATLYRWAGGTATTNPLAQNRFVGVLEQTTAFPLPSSATFAESTANYVPWVSVIFTD